MFFPLTCNRLIPDPPGGKYPYSSSKDGIPTVSNKRSASSRMKNLIWERSRIDFLTNSKIFPGQEVNI